jgi:hypothetical protein
MRGCKRLWGHACVLERLFFVFVMSSTWHHTLPASRLAGHFELALLGVGHPSVQAVFDSVPEPAAADSILNPGL